MNRPGTDPKLLFDAAVEVLNSVDEGGVLVGSLMLFGTVVPTQCEHTHVEPMNRTVQPWN